MSMRDDLKIPLSMLSISFLDKLKFKGSYKGKRFLFEKIVDKEKGDVALQVYIWKDIYNFESTNENDKISKKFPYTKSGIDDGINYVEMTNI